MKTKSNSKVLNTAFVYFMKERVIMSLRAAVFILLDLGDVSEHNNLGPDYGNFYLFIYFHLSLLKQIELI